MWKPNGISVVKYNHRPYLFLIISLYTYLIFLWQRTIQYISTAHKLKPLYFCKISLFPSFLPLPNSLLSYLQKSFFCSQFTLQTQVCIVNRRSVSGMDDRKEVKNFLFFKKKKREKVSIFICIVCSFLILLISCWFYFHYFLENSELENSFLVFF